MLLNRHPEKNPCEDRIFSGCRNMKLVLLFHDRFQRRAFIDKDVIASPFGLAQKQNRGLVDTVDHTVAGNVLVCISESGKRREQIRNMEDVLCS